MPEPQTTSMPAGASIVTTNPSVEQAVLRVELQRLSEAVERDFRSLERQIDLRFKALEVQLDGDAKALDKQAGEYERRLRELNNSHERAISIQATYVDKPTLLLETTDLKRQINEHTDSINKLTNDITLLTSVVGQVSNSVAAITTSQTWLTRLVIGAVVVALLTFVLSNGVQLGTAS